jgi:transposase/regulator of replication initiation timing
MSDLETALLEENTRLKEERTHLREQLNEFERINLSQQATIKILQERVKMYIRRIYGRKSEKIDVSQMVFDDIILAAEKCLKPDEPPPHPEIYEEKVREHIRRKHPGRKALPPELPRIEHYLDIPEEDKYTADGKERPLIGVDVTEKLDYQPSSLVVNRYIRPKYGADDDIEGSGVKQHPPVDGPIGKGLAEPGLLANIITEKYEHHTPLYRQELKYLRLGVDISRKTMAGWMTRCAVILKILYELMRERVLNYDIALNDDTPVKVLDPGSGKTHQGYLWCTVGGEDLKYTMYNFTMSRGRAGPSEFFKGYKGFLLTDDYAGYNEVLGAEAIVPVGCWTHARRYFKEAQDTSPKVANEILTLIARLYQIEQKAKGLSSEERLKIRRLESRRQLAKILLWLRARKTAYLPRSPIAQAIRHALKIRRELTRYTTDGRLPIDNNLAENGIRPIALGRKNWLFLGSETGGETAAILMTFCATCRKLKINTWEYLTDVLQRINTHPMSKIDELLPDRWKEIRQRQSKFIKK